MKRHVRTLVILAALFALSGCAGLEPLLEPPTVSVRSFRLVPSQNAVPQFEIGLHIVNHNRTSLALQGLSYTVAIEGHQLLAGVASDLPVIPAYGEGDVLLLAAPDLLNSINLFTTLMQSQRETLAYELNARLDIGRMLPRIPVVKTGEIALPRGRR